MIYKTTSIKRIIAKVFTDLNLQEGDHRVSDMIEWAGEALEKIGAFPQFVNKVTGKDDIPILEITNYQCRLPYDFYGLNQLGYSTSEEGPFYPMRRATGTMDWGNVVNDSTAATLNVATSELIILIMALYDLDYDDAVAYHAANPDKVSQLSVLVDNARQGTDTTGGTDNSIDYTYTITDNWIKTNVSTGYLMLSYKAVPTDGEGYPLVPDLASFHEALYWYIVSKLLYPKWLAGQIRDAVYFDARYNWNFYCKQAYAEGMMPDTDQMESIKNSWLRLVPTINEHSTFFSTLGEQEIVWNHNKP